MFWRTASVMDQRIRLVVGAKWGFQSISELARRCGIGRTSAAERVKRLESATGLTWKLLTLPKGCFRKVNAPYLLQQVAAGHILKDGKACPYRPREDRRLSGFPHLCPRSRDLLEPGELSLTGVGTAPEVARRLDCRPKVPADVPARDPATRGPMRARSIARGGGRIFGTRPCTSQGRRPNKDIPIGGAGMLPTPSSHLTDKPDASGNRYFESRTNVDVNIITNRVMHYRKPFFDALVSAEGWRLNVIHSGDPTPEEERLWDEESVPTARLGSLRIQWGLASRIPRGDVNVVMFDLHWPAGLWHGLSERSHVPLVWWGHGLGRSPIGRSLRRWLTTRCDAVVVYGHRGREDLVSSGVSEERIHVAPNTVWVESATDTSPRSKDCFLYVGRLQRRKGIDDLIRGFARIRYETTLALVIAGAGPIQKELEDLAEELGVDERVQFVGAVFDSDQLRDLFGRAIAYVSPGHVGLGVLHAFAFGVPVITNAAARHAPEVEWVREEETGFFTDGSSFHLARTMLRLDRDRALARRIGTRCFDIYCGGASPRRMLQGFAAAVDAAVDSRRSM